MMRVKMDEFGIVQQDTHGLKPLMPQLDLCLQDVLSRLTARGYWLLASLADSPSLLTADLTNDVL